MECEENVCHLLIDTFPRVATSANSPNSLRCNKETDGVSEPHQLTGQKIKVKFKRMTRSVVCRGSWGKQELFKY